MRCLLILLALTAHGAASAGPFPGGFTVWNNSEPYECKTQGIALEKCPKKDRCVSATTVSLIATSTALCGEVISGGNCGGKVSYSRFEGTIKGTKGRIRYGDSHSTDNAEGVAELEFLNGKLRWGVIEPVFPGIAVASGLPVLWYNWFYGTAPIWIFWVDSAHQLLGHAVVGAILAGWR